MTIDDNYRVAGVGARRDLSEVGAEGARTELELDDMQRLIVYGFGERRESRYVLLRIVDPTAAKAWLQAQLPRTDRETMTAGSGHGVVTAGRDRGDKGQGVRLALAFTYLGLRRLGLDEDVLGTFVPEFCEGMTAPHRARALGDEGKNASQHWRWGQWHSEPIEFAERQVHVLCAAHGFSDQELEAWTAETWGTPKTPSGFRVVDILCATLQDYEPFQFRDGISQPHIKGSGRADEKVPERDRIEAGEFIFGYPNEFGRFSESPYVPKARDPDATLPPAADANFHDLGRNGTFLVVRELEQDVEGFRALPERQAVSAVGRWRDGTPLVLRPLPLDPTTPVDAAPPVPAPRVNDFTYFPEDAAGLRCPLGAHVRRANPRDALANPELGTSPADAIRLVNNHRILRRSRVFRRRPETPRNVDAKPTTGIFFQCINTNLERQFEFVQQSWINNLKFSGPYEERDVVVGAGSRQGGELTLVAGPERRRLENLHSYVAVRGGAYFFLPGIRALKYLSEPWR